MSHPLSPRLVRGFPAGGGRLQEQGEGGELHGLKGHGEAVGVQAEEGVKLRLSAAGLAREVGVDADQVEDVLSRLRRLRIAGEDEGGTIIIVDPPRLLEFLEFLEMPR